MDEERIISIIKASGYLSNRDAHRDILNRYRVRDDGDEIHVIFARQETIYNCIGNQWI